MTIKAESFTHRDYLTRGKFRRIEKPNVDTSPREMRERPKGRRMTFNRTSIQFVYTNRLGAWSTQKRPRKKESKRVRPRGCGHEFARIEATCYDDRNYRSVVELPHPPLKIDFNRSHLNMTKYSREAFDKAQRYVQKAIKDVATENAGRTAEEDMALPYNLLPSEVDYFRAAHRRGVLADKAQTEARRLESKHRRLIKAVEDAKADLISFEKNELDMHQTE